MRDSRLSRSPGISWLCLACSVAGASVEAQTTGDSPAASGPAPSSSVAVQDEEAGDTRGLVTTSDPWRCQFNTWLWLLGVEGDMGLRGTTTDVSADFADIIEDSDSVFGFSGRLEVGYKRFAGFLDGFYANIGADGIPVPDADTSLDVTIEQTIVDFGVMYRAGVWAPSGDAAKNARDITLDLYAGGRYTKLELELDPTDQPELSGSRDWVDPIAGAKLVLPFAERWHAAFNGDVGGFGVESDLTWSTTGVVGYDFRLFDHPATVYGGYRAIGWDYADDDDPNEFKFDIINHGPMLGFGLRF